MSKARIAGIVATIGIVMVCSTSSAKAQLISIASRAAFNNQFPNQSFEDFEEGRVIAGTSVTFTGPLSIATNNGVFLPGEIVAGISMTTGSPAANNMFLSSLG